MQGALATVKRFSSGPARLVRSMLRPPVRHMPPVMSLYRDIPVVPSTATYFNRQLVNGGPVWPDFGKDLSVRHFRNGKPVDEVPAAVDAPHDEIGAACVWGGYVHKQFGHLVAEHMTRLPLSLAQRPDDRYLFSIHPAETVADVRPHVWSVFDWYGLPREQVHFVLRPHLVRELRVAPQGEHLMNWAPEPYFLDLLDRNMARQGLEIVPDTLVFVTRAGLVRSGQGGNAGEGYLMRILRELGASILDPGRETLRAQMEIYAGAAHLVFSEGSAMHGRQLLGRVPQRISVLERRPGVRFGARQLSARCDSLEFIPATTAFAAPIPHRGNPNRAQAVSFYDVETLFGFFGGLGIDLSRHWVETDYLAACDEDITDWLSTIRRRKGRYDYDRTVSELKQVASRLPLYSGLGAVQ